jgi:alpha-L-rhamnosidase
MKRPGRMLAWVAAVAAFMAAPGAAAETPAGDRAGIVVAALACEGGEDPVGVDRAAPRLSWKVTGTRRGQTVTHWRILVASSPGRLDREEGDVWDSGRVASDAKPFADYRGRPLRSSETVYWTLRVWDERGEASPWSRPARWTMGVLEPGGWEHGWIGAEEESQGLLLRREFDAGPRTVRALLHVSGLGNYECSLNGERVGRDLLSPGWTNYRRTVLYDTYDVTALLRPGRNVIGLALAGGMYRVERPAGRFAKFTGSFGPLRAIVQLRLEDETGDLRVVGSDAAWRTHSGPLTFAGIYGGEDHDARRLPVGWDRPGFDDAGWRPARALDFPRDVLRGFSHASEPLQIIETRQPIAVRDLGGGVSLVDFGQNAAFIPRLRLAGPAGSALRFVPGEVVTAEGEIERGTMGGAHRGSAWWQYTKRSDAEETWFPQFYYVGSRYLRVEPLPGAEAPAAASLMAAEMAVVHAAVKPAGHFATSDPLLNRIRELVRWAQRSNMVSVLTDCPHREKLGWLEQAHLNGPSLRHEFEAARLYAKVMRDMAEAQTPEGAIPNIAPEYTVFRGAFREAAEWGAAFILVPWQHYIFTGDDRPLREHYAAMRRYWARLESRVQDGVLADGLGDWYDHLEGSGKRANLTPAPVTATAFLHECAVTLSRIATHLGDVDEARRLEGRAAEIRVAYRERFRREDGLFGSGSQTSLALALALGLAAEEDRPRLVAALARDVEEKGYATAGGIGHRFLLRALTEGGRTDLIHRMLTQDARPGYAYQLRQGATALTESWNAGTGSSHNHFMLGQVTEWFYAELAGLAPDEAGPGFRRIRVRPRPVDGLQWVEATQETPLGRAAVRWERRGGRFLLAVEVPVGATVDVWIPARPGTTVKESGRALRPGPGIETVSVEGDTVRARVGSGSYRFESER